MGSELDAMGKIEDHPTSPIAEEVVEMFLPETAVTVDTISIPVIHVELPPEPADAPIEVEEAQPEELTLVVKIVHDTSPQEQNVPLLRVAKDKPENGLPEPVEAAQHRGTDGTKQLPSLRVFDDSTRWLLPIATGTFIAAAGVAFAVWMTTW